MVPADGKGGVGEGGEVEVDEVGGEEIEDRGGVRGGEEGEQGGGVEEGGDCAEGDGGRVRAVAGVVLGAAA